jgi:outer membrane lipoprotein SlyB
MALRIRRGTDAERLASGGVVFAEGELIYVTDTDALYIGDGSTPGGILLADENSGTLTGFISTGNNEINLERDLNLNGNDIVGSGNINIDGQITATGNISIGDNVTQDTVTLFAKVNSDIIPKEDSEYDLGKTDKRWQNIYATGLVVDGQIDAVSLNANTVADNSTVMVNVSNNTFTGNLTGDVTGNVSGNLSGNVTGNVNGDVVGNLVGSVFSDNSTTLVDGIAGVLRGDHYGFLFGNVKASNGDIILNAGTDGTDASIVATVVGNVTGNVTGNVSGNLIGNSTGFHTGDVKGSVFADNSTILVDAVAGVIPGSVISGTVTANLIGNVTGNVIGNVTGNVEGNILTNSIDSADSTTIVVTPAALFESDVNIQNTLIVGFDFDEGQTTIFKDTVVTANLGSDTIRLTVKASETDFEQGVEVFGELSTRTGLVVSGVGTNGFLAVQTFNGDINSQDDIDNDALYDLYASVENTKATFNVPVKFPNFSSAERDSLDAETGMVIFNTDVTKLQVCTVGGGTPTWVDLH